MNSVDSGVRDPKKSLFYFLALVSRPVPENKNAHSSLAIAVVAGISWLQANQSHPSDAPGT